MSGPTLPAPPTPAEPFPSPFPRPQDHPVTDTKPVLAWHGDPELKAATVARMKAHREADDFIQRRYLLVDAAAAKGFRGCFHGCLTAEAIAAEKSIPLAAAGDLAFWWENAWWEEAERLFGIPADLGALLDDIFEAQASYQAAGDFAVRVTEAIPVGADLTNVFDDFCPAHCDHSDDVGCLIAIIAAAPVPEVASPASVATQLPASQPPSDTDQGTHRSHGWPGRLPVDWPHAPIARYPVTPQAGLASRITTARAGRPG